MIQWFFKKLQDLGKWILKNPLLGGILGLLIVFAVLVISINFRTISKQNASLKTVAVIKVMPQDLVQSITLTGELHPYTFATLYAKVAGYLKEIRVDIGDSVKARDVLSIIDTPELEDELKKNKAHYEISKIEYDRISDVRKKRPGLVAQETVDKAYANYRMAKAAYEYSKTMYNYSKITAPYDGIITKRFVDAGAMIQVGTNSSTQAVPVVEIADNTKLRLIFPVPESIVSQVAVGTSAEINIPSIGYKSKNKIARISHKITKNTRTMEAQIDVENPSLTIKPGMYAYITLNVDQKKGVLAIPVQTLNINSESHVFVVNKKGDIEKRSVKTGLKTSEMVEIIEGLSQDDLVVFGDWSTFTEGAKVEPKVIELPKIQKAT